MFAHSIISNEVRFWFIVLIVRPNERGLMVAFQEANTVIPLSRMIAIANIFHPNDHTDVTVMVA